MPAAIVLASLLLGPAVPLNPRAPTEVPPADTPAIVDAPEPEPPPSTEPEPTPAPPIQRPDELDPEPEESTQEPESAPSEPAATSTEPAPAPVPVPVPVPQGVDEEVAPGLEREVAEPTPIETSHLRMYLRLGAGIGHCSAFECQVAPMGGGAMFDAGFRTKYVAVGALVLGGGGRGKAPNLDSADPAKGAFTFLFVGPKIAIHPITKGAIDAHFDLALGWSRVTTDYDVGGFTVVPWSEKLSRGAVMLGGGIDFFANRYIAIGPDFSIGLPFAGKACFEQMGMNTCVDTSELFSGQSAPNKRALRRALPRIWTVMLAVRIPLGPSVTPLPTSP